MSDSQEIFIVGDTHGDWSEFNTILNKIRQKREMEGKEVVFLVCGDFGYWPHFEQFNIEKIKNECSWAQDGFFKIYFCPGNHEDWWSLNNLESGTSEKIIELKNNIFYCSFGAVKTFKGFNFLFVGGADSIDKNHRQFGIDWFPEEVITNKDVMNLPMNRKIDVVISHTCPDFILPEVINMKEDFNDPSCKALTYVYETFLPKKWYFGHFHKYKKTFKGNCMFTCLSYIRSNMQFMTKFEGV